MRKTNETYLIEVSSPLLRPGLKISTEVSKGYLVTAMMDLMEQVRDFNSKQDPVSENSQQQ